MPLGVEVGLGPGHFVLDGDPDPSPPKGGTTAPPLFCRCLLWPNDWMHPMPFGTEVGLDPGVIVLDGDSARPTKRGTAASPHFSAYFALTRSPISGTAELLLKVVRQVRGSERWKFPAGVWV